MINPSLLHKQLAQGTFILQGKSFERQSWIVNVMHACSMRTHLMQRGFFGRICAPQNDNFSVKFVDKILYYALRGLR